MRRSVVTGMMRIRHWMHGQVTLLLHDGAEAVLVRDEDAIASFVTADGDTRYTFVYCGPAATLPWAYRERLEEDVVPGADVDAYVFELSDGRTVRTWRQMASARLAEMVGHDTVWRKARDDFAFMLETGEQES